MVAGEPDLEDVGLVPVRVGVGAVELALVLDLRLLPGRRALVVPVGVERGAPCESRVGLGHFPGLDAAVSVLRARVPVKGRLESGAALVQGEGLAEHAKRPVGASKGQGVGDDAD